MLKRVPQGGVNLQPSVNVGFIPPKKYDELSALGRDSSSEKA